MSTTARSPKKHSKSNKKVTDFFHRKSFTLRSAPSSSQPPPSQPPVPQTKTAAATTFNEGQSFKGSKNKTCLKADVPETISISSTSRISISSDSVQLLSTRPRTFMDSVEIASSSSPKPKNSRPTRLTEASNRSIENSQTPEIQLMGASQRPVKKPVKKALPSSTTKRKKSKFDTDSDIEQLDSVVHVSKLSLHSQPSPTSKENVVTLSRARSRTNLSPNKKPRLSSPVCVASEAGELVPSSQSDEQELSLNTLSAKKEEEMKKAVFEWQEAVNTPGTSSVDLGGYGVDAMDVDQGLQPQPYMDPLTPSSLSALSPLPSEVEVYTQLHSGSAHTSITRATSVSIELSQPATPPTTDPAPIPATPAALNVESKTAQIIAQIKAKAYAESPSSADEKHAPLKYRELDESTDDDDLDVFSMRKSDKGEGSSTSAWKIPLSDNISAAPSTSGRYQLRARKGEPTPMSSNSPPVTQPSDAPKGRRATSSSNKLCAPLANVKGKNKSKVKKSDNPLELLLREKKLADKRGKGMDALRRAEYVTAGKVTMLSEMDREVSDGEDAMMGWGNEEAAANAAKEGVRIGLKSSSPMRSPSGSIGEDLLLGEEEHERLGLKGGKAMTKILQSDKKKKKEIVSEKVLGVSFWSESDFNDMDVDEDQTLAMNYPLDGVEGHPILHMFKIALNTKNTSRAILLLESGILISLEPTKSELLIPCLCELALSTRESPLSEPAFRVLSHLWSGKCHTKAGMPLTFAQSALARLGASQEALTALKWTSQLSLYREKVPENMRIEVVYRLVELLNYCARAGGLSSQDTPDIVMALLLIASDPSTSSDLQRDISVTVDVICRSVSSETEVAVCLKLVDYAAGLTPINKAQFVSFLSAGSTQAQRIARWLAHCLLTETTSKLMANYTSLPPLSSLTGLLRPKPGSDALFDTQNSNLDYEDLGYYVDILSVALSNIDDYVAEERETIKPEIKAAVVSAPDSPRLLGADRAAAPLELLHAAIDNVYNKIVDTRAAHLDRSRTKAALQRLSMRIFYQRNTALKSGLGKPRNLSHYFTSGN